jgi:hypothetical protein
MASVLPSASAPILDYTRMSAFHNGASVTAPVTGTTQNAISGAIDTALRASAAAAARIQALGNQGVVFAMGNGNIILRDIRLGAHSDAVILNVPAIAATIHAMIQPALPTTTPFTPPAAGVTIPPAAVTPPPYVPPATGPFGGVPMGPGMPAGAPTGMPPAFGPGGAPLTGAPLPAATAPGMVPTGPVTYNQYYAMETHFLEERIAHLRLQIEMNKKAWRKTLTDAQVQAYEAEIEQSSILLASDQHDRPIRNQLIALETTITTSRTLGAPTVTHHLLAKLNLLKQLTNRTLQDHIEYQTAQKEIMNISIGALPHMTTINSTPIPATDPTSHDSLENLERSLATLSRVYKENLGTINPRTLFETPPTGFPTPHASLPAPYNTPVALMERLAGIYTELKDVEHKLHLARTRPHPAGPPVTASGWSIQSIAKGLGAAGLIGAAAYTMFPAATLAAPIIPTGASVIIPAISTAASVITPTASALSAAISTLAAPVVSTAASVVAPVVTASTPLSVALSTAISSLVSATAPIATTLSTATSTIVPALSLAASAI